MADDLIDILHARGQRVTPQRLAILRALRDHGAHATAEEICRTIRDDLPGTSVPTVYATLDLLVELGLARKLDLGLGSARYDARTDPHQHAVCRGCGRIDDLELLLDRDRLERATREAAFHPDSAELVVTGLCRECYGVNRTVITSPSATT
jgi:Fur family transcriptional regulator, stress-responsive regulator